MDAGSATEIFGLAMASAIAPITIRIPAAAEQSRNKSVGVPFADAATHAVTMPDNDAILPR